jgi:hypothetical protein
MQTHVFPPTKIITLSIYHESLFFKVSYDGKKCMGYAKNEKRKISMLKSMREKMHAKELE